MKKKSIAITIILIILLYILLSGITVQEANSDTVEPTKLKIYISPTSALADNSTYNCIFVQLQDSNGKPTRAVEDTTISLSSSLTNIGTVDPSIIIHKGQTFASANFYATFSPGTTTIAAAATGFATVQSTITTIGPIPSAVAVYGFPSTLPADGASHEAIMVQLQDSTGSPAKAPKEGVQVTLSCSDTSVGTVTPTVTISEGKTCVMATFNTTTKAQDQGKIATATITSVSQGYTSKQVTITTTPIASKPNQLKIFVGPPKIPADQNSYRIAIELQNASGYAGKLSSDVSVSTSTNDQGIASIDSQITILHNQSYSQATLNTTFRAGTTTITAVATDLLISQQAITTTGFIPSKLAIYCAPSTLASDKGTYDAIQVQLQDSQGRPAKDPEADVIVNLFSSQPTIGTINSTLTIPFGKTQASGTLTVTNAPGSTSITAQASSYITGQATITTYLIDFSPIQITLTANPETVNNGAKTQITADITADNTAVTGAAIQFTSNNGGTFSTVVDQGNGQYKINFTAPSFTKTIICTITAIASKTGYLNSQATTEVTVEPPPTSTPTPNPTPTPSHTTTPSPTTTPTPSPNPGSTPTPTPSSNSTSNGNTGILKLRITDNNGNPLGNANITSTAQPTGMRTLVGVTNETGYVIFNNATAGSYTFSTIKEGYGQISQGINFKGQPTTFTIIVTSENSASASTDNSLIIVAVTIAVVLVAVIGGVLVIRRRKSRNKYT